MEEKDHIECNKPGCNEMVSAESIVRKVFPESWINKQEDGTIIVGPPKQVNNA